VPVASNEERRSDDTYALAPVQGLGAIGAVEGHHLVIRITQQLDPEPVLGTELLVLGTAVRGDADHLDAQRRVLIDKITELTRLFGATGRVISGIEVDDDSAPGEISERDDGAVLVGQGKRRGVVALDQFCHAHNDLITADKPGEPVGPVALSATVRKYMTAEAEVATTFAGLGVAPELVEALERQGIRRPFPVQQLTIQDALAGRDVCGKAKTGSGKTLAFGLPMLMRTPRAVSRAPTSLVLVPTRELAVQVADVLRILARTVDRRVLPVYGGTDLDRQTRQLAKGTDIVVATPGRLIDLADRKAVRLDSVSTLVVDEADRMADMGFLPQVEWLLRLMPSERQTLLFSATLDSAVDQVVRRHLRDPVLHHVQANQVTVEEMEHRFFKVHQLDKAKVCAAIVAGSTKALCFCRTKRGADRLVDDLRREGVRAAAIHGDLRQTAREKALEDFASGKLPALVATDVAARGLDIDGVDVVVHYDPPEDHKAYLHRSGRTARAGEGGVAVTLVLWDQELAVERLQRRIGLRLPIVEVFSNDLRLAKLADWSPAPSQA